MNFRILSFIFVWIIILAFVSEIAVKNQYFPPSNLKPYLIRKWDDFWIDHLFKSKMLNQSSKKYNILLGGSICVQGIKSDSNLDKLHNSNYHFKSFCSPWRSFSDDLKIINTFKKPQNLFFILDQPRFLVNQSRELTKLTKERMVYKYSFFPLEAEDWNYFTKADIPYRLSDKVTIINSYKIFREGLKRNFKRYFLEKKFSAIELKRYSEKSTNKLLTPELKEKIFKNQSKKTKENQLDIINKNFELFKYVISKSQKRGHRISVILFPLSPTFEAKFHELFPNFVEKFEKMKELENIDFLYSLQGDNSWKEIHFRDTHHMRTIGRNKFEDIFKQKISPLLTKEGF